MNCRQKGCDLEAAFRYTWPGQREAGACLEHAEQLRGVADAIGLALEMIPIDTGGRLLAQEREAQAAQAAVRLQELTLKLATLRQAVRVFLDTQSREHSQSMKSWSVADRAILELWEVYDAQSGH